MALTLAAKAPGATYLYTWLPPLAVGDTLSGPTLSVASGDATLGTYAVDGDGVSLEVSGGTAGTTTVITASVGTLNGETLADTLYIPIRASTVTASNTALDVCKFALRKINGLGVTPDSDQQALALEILNDMLAEWRMDGMDIGVPLVVVEATTLAIPDEFLSALKYNLTVRVAEDFGREISPIVATNAERGKMLVANRLLSLSDLSFEGPCLPLRTMRGLNDL